MSDAQIFQVFSIVYLSIGLGMLINSDFYKKLLTDLIESAAVMYLGGIMALAIGFLIVAFHNTWTCDLHVIITVIGWLALVKGISILAWPKMMIELSSAVMKGPFLKIMAVWVIFLGLLFSFLGFCPKSPI
ncbi:MAG: hypothetical protein H8E62_00860 [Planctomycetes bacterium]|nr:hypothetical protein [Planctomycetota bacterium]